MKNFEKYHKELEEQTEKDDAICYWKFCILKENECNMLCKECSKQFMKWLNEKYKEVS